MSSDRTRLIHDGRLSPYGAEYTREPGVRIVAQRTCLLCGEPWVLTSLGTSGHLDEHTDDVLRIYARCRGLSADGYVPETSRA